MIYISLLRGSLFFHFPGEACSEEHVAVSGLCMAVYMRAETPPEDLNPDPVLDETVVYAALNTLSSTFF